MKKYLFLLIAISVLIAGCQNTYCPPDEAEASIAELDMIVEEWIDGLILANSTPRMALPGQISELQQIKRKVSSMDVPECLEEARDSLEFGMDSAITGLVSFMNQMSDETVSTLLGFWYESEEEYYHEIDSVKECLPNCKAP